MNWRKIKQQKITQKPSPKVAPKYAGFWSRVLAITVDIFMIGIPIEHKTDRINLQKKKSTKT